MQDLSLGKPLLLDLEKSEPAYTGQEHRLTSLLAPLSQDDTRTKHGCNY